MSKFNPLDHFISFTQPLRVAPSTWAAHVPFAMFMVDMLRPAKIVELGTQYGVSYCAFCQAVKLLRLNTRCYAVDTWLGDDHAGHYGSDVLVDLKKHHDPLYTEFSHLIQSTFDNALDRFSNESIDLLHIDGYHTYDAVRHDFESWLPKMSSRGIVLFHDIAVKDAGFEVWKFWDEVTKKYPHFEFSHGYGLGILAIGREYPSELDLLFRESENLSLVKDFFLQMGSRTEKEYLLSGQIAEKERVLQEILNGRAWKFVTMLRRIRTWLYPVVGSKTNPNEGKS